MSRISDNTSRCARTSRRRFGAECPAKDELPLPHLSERHCEAHPRDRKKHEYTDCIGTAFPTRLAARPWHAVNTSEPAVLGDSGMAWGPDFHGIALRGEPQKSDGDMRSPGGIYRVGRSFGFAASSRPAYLQLLPRKTVCVDDPSSPAYNTITTRAAIGSNVHTEDMSGNLYRRGLVIDYPTDAAAKSGSCIFIHVWRAAERGTSGCVGLPEPRVASLQDFSGRPTAVAILPHGAIGRFAGCLPEIARGTVTRD